MHPWIVPPELVVFIDEQLKRFRAPAPSDKTIDVIGDFVVNYAIENNYFVSAPEAAARYARPGLTEPEKFQIIGPLEYHLKVQLRQSVTTDQIHLVAWAALLFCWSEKGEEHVAWYRKINTKVPVKQVSGGSPVQLSLA
jgi:hypothetical protein